MSLIDTLVNVVYILLHPSTFCIFFVGLLSSGYSESSEQSGIYSRVQRWGVNYLGDRRGYGRLLLIFTTWALITAIGPTWLTYYSGDFWIVLLWNTGVIITSLKILP